MEKEFDELVSFLDRNKIKYKVWEHKAVHTSEEAAAIRNVELKTGVKALVFKIQKEKHDGIVLVLVRGDHKVDSQRLSRLLGAKNAKLASKEEVLDRTLCEIGSVHPFGNLFGLDVYMDKSILENKEINFSAGMHTKSISMRTEDMIKLIKPKLVDVAKT